MKDHKLYLRKEALFVAAALLASCGLAQAASTSIANSPLFTAPASNVQPNIMFLLDDSGSMQWDFMPDNVGNGTTNMCRSNDTTCDSNGNDGNLNGSRTYGAPFLASQFNVVSYDPTITYSPPMDYNGVSAIYQTYNNTWMFLWSAVKVNPYPGGSTSTTNLTNSFPEEVWCDGSQSGPTDAVHCRRNLQPNATFSVSLSNSRSSTTNTTTVTLNNHNCQVGDKVTIVNAATAGFNGTFTVSSIPNANTYTYQWTSASNPAAPGGTPAASACNIPITVLSSGGNTATAVFPVAHGCNVGDTIKISGSSTGGYNSAASGNPASFTVSSVPSPNSVTYSTALANSNLPVVQGTGSNSGQFVARSTLCPATPSNYSVSNTVPPLMQGFPQGRFTQKQTLPGTPYSYTILPNEYCADENLTNCQSTINQANFSFPATVRYCVSSTAANASPGAPGATGNGTTTGCDRVYAGSFNRARFGYFIRNNIVSTTTAYPKASTRTDCVTNANSCTFTEEMTNFANWYAYYRTRIQMVKSAAGIAFNRLNSSYRVGFNTINAVDTSKWLANAPFDNAAGGQKNQWYNKLYAINPNSSTPLRTALSRIGRYYAGMKSSAASYISDDPILNSCQQNLTFIITDGYWNGGGGIKLDGSAMGDQDGNANVGRPFFDAFAASGGDGGGTLADIAYYYWNTDLRTPSFNPIGGLGLDVSQNNVPPTSKDPNTAQHMVTFTMGLGLDSTLLWYPGYDTAGTSSDYNAVKSGVSNGNWSVSPNWPVPVHDAITAVDDLWHAAVNGHGTYFSARSPKTVTGGLLEAFATVAQRTSSESAAATSTPNIVPADNFVFSSTYTTGDWFGETIEQEIDASTGQLIPTINWSAQTQLDAMVSATSDTRTIYTFDYGPSPAASKLKNFLWGNLLPNEQAYFNGTSGGRNLLAQWSVLTSSQQTQCDAGDSTNCGQKLVNYLRGQRAYETPVNSLVTPDAGIDSLFRHRPHILGDIVSAEAVYVRVPIFNYGDQGYAAFKSAQASRQAALYVAANDGMLHALNANTGNEMWAYIPSMVMPNMWNLARFDYSTNHMYFVDGTPTSGDICTSNCSTPSATWATIIVGGLNAGGRGFYALDITNPASPKALWELKSPANCTISAGVNVLFVGSAPQDPVTGSPPIFSDCDIGLSFGNPIITKRADGKWVVLVTSGYNNIVPGTGGGFLYVIDAVTGAILNKIATLIPGSINAGNTTTPSGLARINAFVNDTQTDNTSLRVYGGDLNGNLWRFDNANSIAVSGNTATLLAILGTAAGSQGSGSQPITTKPELGEISVSGVGTFEIVYVGTGQYLGVSDISNTSQQSFYAIKDPLGAFSGWGAVHSNPNMVQQTLTEAIDPVTLETDRFTTANMVDFTSKIGWFIDFNPGSASPGERSNTDPALDLGILSFTTNAPDTNACNLGGKSYRYFLNYTTGGPLPSSPNGVSGTLVAFALATRPIVVEVGGKLEQIINTQGVVKIFPLPPLSPPAGGKRIFWREITP